MKYNRSFIVVGARSLDVLKRTFKTSQVRKYNVDTGEPYMWENKEEFWILFGKEHPAECYVEGILREMDKDLQLFEPHCVRDSDDWQFDPGDSGIFGYEAHSCDGYNPSFVKVDFAKIEELLKRFYKVTGAQPDIFLIQRPGCE